MFFLGNHVGSPLRVVPGDRFTGDLGHPDPPVVIDKDQTNPSPLLSHEIDQTINSFHSSIFRNLNQFRSLDQCLSQDVFGLFFIRTAGEQEGKEKEKGQESGHGGTPCENSAEMRCFGFSIPVLLITPFEFVFNLCDGQATFSFRRLRRCRATPLWVAGIVGTDLVSVPTEKNVVFLPATHSGVATKRAGASPEH
ncbi:hypothetical protein A2239_02560 [Candidatus Uhrbacteria bacterium RIFOXYA2_FULL_40_9]|nr:MAG: hypothetical protein A2239_02560 [Candidatus Uhrbacteria bacterium RIFOXYA2_FULL_40_9]